MLFYRRNLPHWHPEGAVLFLTWRLCGSLPASFNTAKIGCATDSPGKRFKTLDAILDKAATGALWLNNPQIALSVVNGIQTGACALNFYDLHAFAVMPNHVHLLISPKILVPRIMNGLKGVTAHDANLILGRESISGRTNPSITGFALSGSSTASAPTSNSIPFPRVWLLVRRTGPGPAPPTTGNLSSRGTACSCGTANHGRARTQCALTECREAPPPTQPVPEDSAQVTKSGETMLLFLLPPL